MTTTDARKLARGRAMPEHSGQGRAMSLIDLRAYFQRGSKAAPCRDEEPGPGGALGWLCTLPRDHHGRHVAHDVDGTVITTWTPTGASPTAPVGLTPPPEPSCAACGDTALTPTTAFCRCPRGEAAMNYVAERVSRPGSTTPATGDDQ